MIEPYFRAFAQELSARLKRFGGELPANWARIDRDGVSVVLYLAGDGYIARVVRRLGGDDLRVRSDLPLKDVLQARWSGAGIHVGQEVVGSALVKPLAGAPAVTISIANDALVVAPERPDSSLLVVAPLLRGGMTKPQRQAMQAMKNDRERERAGQPVPVPPWFAAVVSSRTGAGALDGLDPDPAIAAQGVADAIARCAGLVDEDPVLGYRRERERLERSEPGSPRIDELRRREDAATFMGSR